MKILGIETSCDETAAAVLEQKNGRIQILSNVIASSASIQAKYGGVIPEQAAREQLKSIIPVIEETLNSAKVNFKELDAVAVTYGPGLIGSLLVGVETAKTLSRIWQKPLIPINHLIGHFYANWIFKDSQLKTPQFPCLGLLVSGGHSDLVLFTGHGKYRYLGGTRDDAAGECFDKCARLLNLPYPGGPQISKLAKVGNPKRFKLPIPMHGSKDLDFSFSGLKTAVANLIKTLPEINRAKGEVNGQTKADLCAAIEKTIITSLVQKTVIALKQVQVKQLIVAGGVAASQRLSEELGKALKQENLARAQLFIPPAGLCTDNAAMIASAAFFEEKTISPLKLQADPNLSLAY